MNILPYTQADQEVRELARHLQLVCEHPDVDKFVNQDDERHFDWICAQCGDETDFGKLFNECIDQACSLFITNQGQSNYTNIRKLEKVGYRVVDGERDSFGPLSMVIITPKGRVAYG